MKISLIGQNFDENPGQGVYIYSEHLYKNLKKSNNEFEKIETKDIRSYHISSEKIRCALGFEPKKTVRDAIRDLKEAFELGLIPNPSNSIYRNIERMKEIKIK